MKTIMVLQTIQLLAIVVLLAVVLHDQRSSPIAPPESAGLTVSEPVEHASPGQTADTTGHSLSANERTAPAADNDPFSAILQRQLAELSARLTAEIQAIQQHDPADKPALVSEQQILDQQIQQDLVQQELDYYIEQGVISDQEMSKLQLEIAKLSREGQKEAMRRLVRAMNAGQLDGHL